MEVVHHQTRSKVSTEVGEDDVISSMPENVVTNIMNRLPLRDAVRTSILSASWRFKWTLLTQLVFDDGLFNFDKTNISRLLFHLKGAITKFVLYIANNIKADDEDIHHWVMFLSRIRGFKELTLTSGTPMWGIIGEVKLVEIAKLKNVKKLTLSLCLLDNMNMVRLSTVFQHLSLLPKLQELRLDFENCKFLPEDVAQNSISITFPFLKTLTLHEMDFSSDSMLSCVFRMLFGCANLQTLYIIAIDKYDVHPPAIISPEVDCDTMGQLQLRNVSLAFIKRFGK